MRKFIKAKQGIHWSITDYYESEQPKDNVHNFDMSINRDFKASISGGPVVAYFAFEKDADEYCKFKNEQINGK